MMVMMMWLLQSLKSMEKDTRSTSDWVAQPLVCKRWNVKDPWKGRSKPNNGGAVAVVDSFPTRELNLNVEVADLRPAANVYTKIYNTDRWVEKDLTVAIEKKKKKKKKRKRKKKKK